LATNLNGTPTGLSDLFLFTRAGAITCSVFLKVSGFEVPEPSNFGEFNVLDLSGIAANRFVKVDDFGVRIGKGSEKLQDVFGVLLQLKGTVWEGTEDGCGGGSPSNGPVSMSLDDFGWFTSTDGEVKISDGSGSFVVGESGEQSRENGVKVDRRSRKDMLPFGLWERRE
jgi:hypothetical protein